MDWPSELTGARFNIGDIVRYRLNRGGFLFYEIACIHFYPTNGSVKYEVISLLSNKMLFINESSSLNLSSAEEYLRWLALRSISS